MFVYRCILHLIVPQVYQLLLLQKIKKSSIDLFLLNVTLYWLLTPVSFCRHNLDKEL